MKHSIKNANELHEANLSYMDKVSLFITQKIGTMGFFALIFFWTLAWLLWNTLAKPSMRFDPSPTFQIWLFISNLIQIMLMPLIMIGQNLQGKHAETRAENDYNINKKAELEVMELHAKIDLLIQKIEEQQKTSGLHNKK